MIELNDKLLKEIEDKIVVENEPFPNSAINNFLPTNVVKKAEEEFLKLKEATSDAGCKEFQKTKRVLYSYSKMPTTIKDIINFFYSPGFIKILENKFKMENLVPDWNLHGGGLHESFKGGFLKIHSDFIYMRKSKLRRKLNLLIYLNSDWKEDWKGSIELWDNKMTSSKKSILPIINNAVIFRTDVDSNHGFPEPIECPDNVTRKSLALYYYSKEKTILPIAIRRRKHFHAVWKQRPNKTEPKFADNDPFFKRLKYKFFYRFF